MAPDAEHAGRQQRGGGAAGLARVAFRGDRIVQHGDRALVAVAGQGKAEVKQQLRPGRGGRRLRQRPPQVAGGGARVATAAGGRRGRPQHGDGMLVGRGLAAQQVQPDQFRRGAVGFQQGGRARVGQGALARRYRIVERGPHDRVLELEQRSRAEYAGRPELVGERRRVRQVHTRQRRRVAQRRGAAEHRKRPGERDRTGAELAHPANDGLGHRRRAERQHRHLVGAGLAGCAQRLQQRVQQERVSTGGGVGGQAQLGARPVAEPGRRPARRTPPG